jgi:hypothetical protein
MTFKAIFLAILVFFGVSETPQAPMYAEIRAVHDGTVVFSSPGSIQAEQDQGAPIVSSPQEKTSPTERRGEPKIIIIVQEAPIVPEPVVQAQPPLPEATSTVQYVHMAEATITVEFGEKQDQFSSTPYFVHVTYSEPNEDVTFKLEANGKTLDSGPISYRNAIITEKDGKWDYSHSGYIAGTPIFTIHVGETEASTN